MLEWSQQSFVIPRRPKGEGPLEITLQIELGDPRGHGYSLERKGERRLVVLDSEQKPVFTWSAPVALDRTGLREDLPFAVQATGEGARVRMVVPRAVLDRASYPLLVDPTYTAKAMAGFLSRAKHCAEHAPGSKLLFIHTGGQPALFAYQAELSEYL